MSRRIRIAFGVTAAAVLAACASNEVREQPPPAWPDGLELAQAAGGSIYSADRNIALFENAVARNVGDIVTIRLVERTAASKSASTTTSKATSASLPGPTIAGRPVTVNGTPVLETSVENESTFDGAGASNQSNRLDGNVTVTVVRRLPNGNLLVRGEKWLTLNQGREVVRLQGVIRPIDIEPDNTIPSSKVANAVISYAGRGPIANANAPGLLARFFNSPWLPF